MWQFYFACCELLNMGTSTAKLSRYAVTLHCSNAGVITHYMSCFAFHKTPALRQWTTCAQGFLNRLHSSALANQQRLDSTAPLSEALAPTPPASPAVPSGTPADPFWQAALDPEPVHMSRKPQAASPPRKQVLAHSTTPGKVLSEADADETASQQCPTAAAAAADAAAPVCIEDTCVGTDSVPLLGITSSASHVTAAAVVAEDASAANDAAAVAKDRAPHDQHSRTADCDMEDAAVSDIKLSLEWLRSAPPQVASAFLLSVEGQLCFRKLKPKNPNQTLKTLPLKHSLASMYNMPVTHPSCTQAPPVLCQLQDLAPMQEHTDSRVVHLLAFSVMLQKLCAHVDLNMIAIIGTSDQPCWLAEACKVLLL